MERDCFDALAISLAERSASRRAVLGRLTAGGVAAALGLTAAAARERNEAEARKTCQKRCKKKHSAKKRRKCRKRCQPTTPTTSPPPVAGFPITIDTALLGNLCLIGFECGTNTGLECVGVACLPIDLGDACVSGADCRTGQCTDGACAVCNALNVCGTAGNQQCCVADAACSAGLCVLPA
ncbi:MAG: hypothetical protein R2853_04940 [Thermomicrobiales bacterium]